MILVALILALMNSHFLIFFKTINETNFSENVKNMDHDDPVSKDNIKPFKMDESKMSYLNLSYKVELENDNASEVNTTSFKTCMPEKNTKYFDFFVSYWSYIDLLVYSVIPSTVMLLSAIIIVVKVA